jgi:hypothetical protein
MKSSIKALLLIVATSFGITGCESRTPEPASTNRPAALEGQLPYNPLAWKAITAWTNPRQGTMSTLYGNDTAVTHVRSGSADPYPRNSVLAVVTWAQREDPHWFGAKIPSHPQSVEFVTMPSTPEGQPVYARYQGSPLAQVQNMDTDTVRKNVASIVSERAAVMP